MKQNNWQFIDSKGTFRLISPHKTSYLYFPLVNEVGMMSVVTPGLNGDVKVDHNTFLTLPVSVEDLHNSKAGRNFWIAVESGEVWSVTGNSAQQVAKGFMEDGSDEVILEAGFLWHKLARENKTIGLQAAVTSFVPPGDDKVELMLVEITNHSEQPQTFTPTAAIPVFGRSAENLRDHRHVTSLLHRTTCYEHGVLVRPTLSFDERGHKPNATTYVVLGFAGSGNLPEGFFPKIESFIGEGGSLDWPAAVVQQQAPTHKPGDKIDGYESLGGIRFQNVSLQPGESHKFVIVLAILGENEAPEQIVKTYGTPEKAETWLARTKSAWATRMETFRVSTGNSRFDLWMRWVSIQPTLRRLFGNSFLPYHDYGRGGRGWRDLWQDILSLLLLETEDTGETLFNHFAGVRIDGSNANIIGNEPGEFKADRNNIPRVWMDHGVWPLLTTRLYIDQTGDLLFLLREQRYFKDHLTARSKVVDNQWTPAHGTVQRSADGEVYLGTILEHLLVQHLTPYFNIGEHNNILLEGADWNDGMDMAPNRGESVAFSALYAGNFGDLANLVRLLEDHNIERIFVAEELLMLLDTLSDPIDYDSVEVKKRRLSLYFEKSHHTISGRKVALSPEELANDLEKKANWLSNHIRTSEWINSEAGYGWFNGYYDDEGNRVEGDHPLGPRMTLTGQVFALMGGVATEKQAQKIVQSADKYLYDPGVGGYRLNSNFKEVLLNLGRCFGFAFGHKENGAMFSHMAVMYANALYHRGLVEAGYKVLEGMFQHCQNFQVSRMYPGIPEYINQDGRGMYPFLTGSASWYLLTLVTEVFGIRGDLGDLVLAPKLVPEQFDKSRRAKLETVFAGLHLHLNFFNPENLKPDQYHVSTVTVDGKVVDGLRKENYMIIPRHVIESWESGKVHKVDITLARKG